MPRKLTPSAARKMARARKTYGAGTGRPQVTMPCGWCREPQTAREMRTHFTSCPARPAQRQ